MCKIINTIWCSMVPIQYPWLQKKKKNFVHKYMYESQQKKTDINFNFRILEFVIIIYLLLQN